jgi:hypothetical protein
MNSNPYIVLGTDQMALLAREKQRDTLTKNLKKPTPDHVSVVGPRYFGTTVLLKHLANHIRENNHSPWVVLYWDLKHGTPQTDSEFKLQFANKLKDALKSAGRTEAGYVDNASIEDVNDQLMVVFEELDQADMKVLAIMDHFDRVLASPEVTRNLWDYLRSLADYPSLRFVTGSRQPLREICRTEESRTSDFWEIFLPNPVQLTPFQVHDLDALLLPFSVRAIQFDQSSRSELINWAGGVPILVTVLLRELWEEVSDNSTVSKPSVDEVAQKAERDYNQILAEIWDDCDLRQQRLLIGLAANYRGIEVGQVPRAELPALAKRGLVTREGNYARSSCRLMSRFAEQQEEQLIDLERLFGDAELYKRNVPQLLQLRLAAISGMDKELESKVRRMLRDLSDDPDIVLSGARDVFDRAMFLIWDAELGVGVREFPKEWTEARSQVRSGYERVIKDDIVPGSRGGQAAILRAITSSQHTGSALARYVTRPTSVLLDHLSAAGDFHFHSEGTQPTHGFVAATCTAAVELCECLTKDLENVPYRV